MELEEENNLENNKNEKRTDKNEEKNKYYANYTNISSEYLLDYREQFLKDNDPSYGPTKLNARYKDKELEEYKYLDEGFQEKESNFFNTLKNTAGLGMAGYLAYNAWPTRGNVNRMGGIPGNRMDFNNAGQQNNNNNGYREPPLDQEMNLVNYVEPPAPAVNGAPPPYSRLDPNMPGTSQQQANVIDHHEPDEQTSREELANPIVQVPNVEGPVLNTDVAVYEPNVDNTEFDNVNLINDIIPSSNFSMSSTNVPFPIRKVLAPTPTTNQELSEEAIENTAQTNGELFKPTQNVTEIEKPRVSLELKNFEDIIKNKKDLMQCKIGEPVNKAKIKETEFLKTDTTNNLYYLEKMGALGKELSTTSFAVLSQVLSSGFDATKMTAEYALEFAKIVAKGTGAALDVTENFLQWFLPRLATNGPKFLAKHTYDFYKMATFQNSAMFVTGVSLVTSIFIKLVQRQLNNIEDGVGLELNGMFGETERAQYLQELPNMNILPQRNQEQVMRLLRRAQELENNVANVAANVPRISGKTKLVGLALAFSIFASYYGDSFFVAKHMDKLKEAFKYTCWNLGLDPSNEQNFTTSASSFLHELKEKGKDFAMSTFLDDKELQQYHDSKNSNFSLSVPNYSVIEFNNQLDKIQMALMNASVDGIQVNATEVGEYVRNPWAKHEDLINSASNVIQEFVLPIISKKYLDKSNNGMGLVLNKLGGMLMEYSKDKLLHTADHTPELYNTYMEMDTIGNQIKKVKKLDEIVYGKLNSSKPMDWSGEEDVKKYYGLDSFANPFDALKENINYLSNAYYSHTKNVKSFGNFYNNLKHLRDSQISSNTIEISLKDFLLNAGYHNYYMQREEDEVNTEPNNLLRQVKKIVISFDGLLATSYLQGKDKNEVEQIYNMYHDEVFYMLQNLQKYDPIASSNEISLAQSILANFLNFLVFEQKRLKDPSKYSRWYDWFFNAPHERILRDPELLESDKDLVPAEKRYKEAAQDFGSAPKTGRGIEDPYKDNEELQKIFEMYRRHKADNLIDQHKYLMSVPKVGNGLLTKLPKFKNNVKSTLQHFTEFIKNNVPKKEEKVVKEEDLVNCSNCGAKHSNEQPLMGHEKDSNDLLCAKCLNDNIRSGKGETKRTVKWKNINTSPSHDNIHKNHMLYNKQKNNNNAEKLTYLEKFKQSAPKKHEHLMEELGKGYTQAHDVSDKNRLAYALGAIYHCLPQHINNYHKANTYSMMVKFMSENKDKKDLEMYLKPTDFKDHKSILKAIEENPHALKKHLL